VRRSEYHSPDWASSDCGVEGVEGAVRAETTNDWEEMASWWNSEMWHIKVVGVTKVT